MPYTDPVLQRAAQAAWYARKYSADPDFAKKEAERKAAWLQSEEGKASNAAASARARERRAKRRKKQAA